MKASKPIKDPALAAVRRNTALPQPEMPAVGHGQGRAAIALPSGAGKVVRPQLPKSPKGLI